MGEAGSTAVAFRRVLTFLWSGLNLLAARPVHPLRALTKDIASGEITFSRTYVDEFIT